MTSFRLAHYTEWWYRIDGIASYEDKLSVCYVREHAHTVW